MESRCDQEHVEGCSLIEVFKFFNPFQQSGKTMIEQSKAREIIFRLFKTKKETELEKFNLLVNDEKNLLTPSSKRSKNELKNSTQVPIEILKQIPWIFEDKNDGNTTMKEFNIIIISIVTFTIKSLGFLYTLEKSANEKELFLKIYAKEKILIEAAKKVNYRLRVKAQPDWDERVKNFPLYTPINIPKKTNQRDIFLKYDKNGEECQNNCLNDCPHNSHFTVTDKYRISRGILNQKMDFSVLQGLKLTSNRFVPHQEEPLITLKKEWADFFKLLAKKKTRKVRTYFSEQIAFYFCFSNEFKDFLKVLAPIGLFVYLIRLINHFTIQSSNIIYLYITYAMIIIVWSVAFNKHWERREKFLAWQWGTLDFADQKIQREQFKGAYKKDPVTDQMKLIRTNVNKYRLIKIISLLISMFSVSCGLASLYYISEIKYPEFISDVELAKGVTNSIQIILFNFIYTYIAQKLTSWENHETIQEHNDSFIVKVFIFRFINSYASLLYIGIIKRLSKEACEYKSCMKELEKRLEIIFLSGILFNVVEILSPWVLFLYRSREGFCLRRGKFDKLKNEELKKLEIEALLVPYDYALRDYMELCIQFGYISMFGASNHFLAAYALVGAYLESRIDSLKLCTILRRPEPCKTENIGVWKKIFFFISICGFFSSLAITIFNTGLLKTYTLNEQILIFVVSEKTVIIIWVAIWLIVPNSPNVVIDGMSWAHRLNHEFLLKEINQNTVVRRIFSKRSAEFKQIEAVDVGQFIDNNIWKSGPGQCESFEDDEFFIKKQDIIYKLKE